VGLEVLAVFWVVTPCSPETASISEELMVYIIRFEE
jgi:hypothetical protein